jgi:hypothetical protein
MFALHRAEIFSRSTATLPQLRNSKTIFDDRYYPKPDIEKPTLSAMNGLMHRSK